MAERHGKPYSLYLWKVVDILGMETIRRERGKRIGRFARYADLVSYAKGLTISAGYPRSRWQDLYDWNEE
jgi:hypothetical protein